MIVGPWWVYIAVPRTASKSTCEWLERHGGVYPGGGYHASLVPPEHADKVIFATVRNPYDRMVSLYRLVKDQAQYVDGDNHPYKQAARRTMPEFVRWCMEQQTELWSPQAWILRHVIDRVHLLRYEEIGRWGRVLLRINAAKGEMVVVDRETVAAINEHSAEDFERFGYERRSP
jgi:hypothetical protein